jgi:Beta-galactosidase
MPPQGRLEGFLGISGVRGATSVNDFSFAAKIGVGWVRAGISWAEINPAKGVYDWASTDQLLANARAAGLKTVLMVRNTPAWAATTQPYSFVTTGRAAAKGGTNFPTPQRWTVTPSLDASGLPNGYTTRRETLDGKLIDEVRSSFPNLRMSDPDASWRVFIRALVGRYSQAPFDVKFFEIANEHRPESGQYPEDSVESVAERWFVPAAQEAHKFPGVRVMNCWGTDTASEQIDAFDAVPGVLENLDIFGQHYGDFDRWRRIFERYQLKGKPNIAFWATEYGDKPVDAFTWKVSHSYPAILGQVLSRDWSYEDKFKVFWYPSKSKTKPYQSLADENGELTSHGRQVQVLYSLLYGKTLELYTDFTTAPNASATDYAYGFRTDRGAVLAIGLLNAAGAPSRPTITVTLPTLAPSAIKLVRSVDAYGAIIETLNPRASGAGSVLTMNTAKLSDAGMQMMYLEVLTVAQ